MPAFNFHPYRGRTKLLQMTRDEPKSLCWGLVWNEPHRDLGTRPGRNNRLGTVALITTGQSVYFQGGTCAALLDRREAAFAKKFRDAEEFPVSRLVKRLPRHLFSFISRERRDNVVKIGNRDSTILIAQPSEQLAQCHGRIIH